MKTEGRLVSKMKKHKDNPTLEQIAIEQDNEKSYREDIEADYREQERRNRREAEIENERPSWNLNN